ncbi:MAG: hypothetical protein Q7R95_05675 [bacterium]|nr:hypothetical protein [bacterium]
MFKKEVAFYLGTEFEKGFTGYIAENNLLLILSVHEGLSHEAGRGYLSEIKEKLSTESIHSLNDLDVQLGELINHFNLPSNFSMAIGYSKDAILYLKTFGKGRVLLRRGNNFAQIIGNDQTASGYIHSEDIVVFTTTDFIELFGDLIELKKEFDHKKPHVILNDITPKLKSKNDEGTIALFAQFDKENVVVESLNVNTENEIQNTYQDISSEPIVSESIFVSHVYPWDRIIQSIKSIYTNTVLNANETGRKKYMTFIVVILIAIAFFWSVILGYNRRGSASMQKKIAITKEMVIQKLSQVDEVAFLNLPRALVLLNEAKQEVVVLKQQFGDRKEVNDISALILVKENSIVKKEEKSFEEFYDLTLDNKQAKGDTITLFGENVSILDRNQGSIYTLSLTKKSLSKKTVIELKTASSIGLYENTTFVFSPDNGIYLIDENNKIKKIINKDKDWGILIGLTIYNGNIYLLDKSKDEIYKYVSIENGYGDKTSYFKSGEAISLVNSNSLSIDSSLYIGLNDSMVKYTTGVKDSFKTTFPEGSILITKIFTSKNADKVYAWNKSKGSIYVLAKDGAYEKEINSSILTKAIDFVVYDNSAYLLYGSKIFKISLN